MSIASRAVDAGHARAHGDTAPDDLVERLAAHRRP
jgi:hypothetical protein